MGELIEPKIVDVSKSDESEVSSPHINPDWLKNLKHSYRSIVIDKLSQKVKDAVEKDTKFSDVKEHRVIRLAIIHGTLDHIHNTFGGVGRPKLIEMREIVAEMGSVYPAMFKQESSARGYGLGGNKGIEGLANQMLDMLRSREGSRRKMTETEDDAPAKKGKRKQIYGIGKSLPGFISTIYFSGVDNDKWYKDVKISTAASKLARVTEDMEFDERENLYDENRKELMCQFRSVNVNKSWHFASLKNFLQKVEKGH